MKFTIESQEGITQVKINGMEIPNVKSIEFRHNADDHMPMVNLSFYPFDENYRAHSLCKTTHGKPKKGRK